MNNSLQIARICARQLSRPSARAASTGEVKEVPSKHFAKLKENQAKFGIDDGVPVHLKGGFTDRILYLFTAGVITVGTGMCLQVWYKLS